MDCCYRRNKLNKMNLAIISKPNKQLISTKYNLQNYVDKLYDLTCKSFNGKTILENVGDQINKVVHLMVNDLKVNPNKAKRQLMNISSLYESNKQIIGYKEYSLSKCEQLIKNIETITSQQNKDINIFRQFITDNKMPISYVNGLENIILYCEHIYQDVKSFKEHIKEQFIENPIKYLYLHDEIDEMISKIRSIIQTLKSYTHKIVNFKSIYIDNYIKIASDINNNGINTIYCNKLDEMLFDMNNYLTEELLISDIKQIKLIENKK